MDMRLAPLDTAKIDGYVVTTHHTWNYEVVKSAMFNGFGSIHGAIMAYLPNLTTYGHETYTIGIQQRLKFKRVCRNTVTTPFDLEL